ncbi:hypothetical protein LCGC14_1797580 [marine sediment metagenome]|uniref:Uncharacterized protein n=1 Tax=marine sediment metagenome TaxID=412755 RepID=A0A0F9HDA6_9ZZZZ|nr:hypothetical protein [Candidatus Scalindua sp.]
MLRDHEIPDLIVSLRDDLEKFIDNAIENRKYRLGELTDILHSHMGKKMTDQCYRIAWYEHELCRHGIKNPVPY